MILTTAQAGDEFDQINDQHTTVVPAVYCHQTICTRIGRISHIAAATRTTQALAPRR